MYYVSEIKISVVQNLRHYEELVTFWLPFAWVECYNRWPTLKEHDVAESSVNGENIYLLMKLFVVPVWCMVHLDVQKQTLSC